jgi:Dockerin type I domain
MKFSYTKYCILLLFFVQNMAAQPGITWINNCENITVCNIPMSCNEGRVEVTNEAFTTCNNNSLNYLYRVDFGNNGGVDLIGNTSTYLDTLPIGTHSIYWRATDVCGQVITCTFLIQVKDCQPPNLVCINGLTQNLFAPDCESSFTANTFILNTSDNCSPAAQLERGIRVTGTGTGFPSTTSVTFDKCDVGINFVEIWVRDVYGNVNNCNSYVSVQNNTQSGCSCNQDADIRLKGCVTKPDMTRLSKYTMKSQVQSTGGTTMPVNTTLLRNSIDSCYDDTLKMLTFGGNYTVKIRPIRNDLATNGVSTFDLLTISKHILGVQPLTSNYQLLAADVNKSGSITTFDIVEIRKVILGIYDTFPVVDEWQFMKPISSIAPIVIFPEYAFSFTNLLNDTTINGLDFVAVKSGDVNYSASLTDVAEDRNEEIKAKILAIEDQILSKGKTYSIDIKVTENMQFDGFQWGFSFDNSMLEMQSIGSDVLPDFSENNYFIKEDGTVRVIWFDKNVTDINSGKSLITLKIKALKDINLSEAMSNKLENFNAESYLSNEYALRAPLDLQFMESKLIAKNLQIRPNPFSENTHFSFFLAESQKVKLAVFDSKGSQVHTAALHLEKGEQNLVLEGKKLNAGLYFYRLVAENQVFSGTLVKE